MTTVNRRGWRVKSDMESECRLRTEPRRRARAVGDRDHLKVGEVGPGVDPGLQLLDAVALHELEAACAVFGHPGRGR